MEARGFVGFMVCPQINRITQIAFAALRALREKNITGSRKGAKARRNDEFGLTVFLIIDKRGIKYIMRNKLRRDRHACQISRHQ